MLRISSLKLNLGASEAQVREECRRVLQTTQPFKSFTVVKKAFDTRSRGHGYEIYTIDVEFEAEEQILAAATWPHVEKIKPLPPLSVPRLKTSGLRPLIVGSGPAGMLAGLILAEAGLNPLIIERGRPVAERQRDVKDFWQNRKLNPESNVQFGEGGAGTFSDGKLMTGIKKDAVTAKVFAELVEAGAPEEILWLSKPHLGTDKLAEIVPNIRKKIISLGGEYRFEHKLEGLIVKNGRLTAVRIAGGGKTGELPAENVILAIGHSARDTFEMLFAAGVPLTAKPFSVGVRIEHPQELINRAVHHNLAGHPVLGAADYKLSVHLPNGRSAYTFCMCPGGEVVAAASEPGRLVTNGMSYYARNKVNANSALLVGVDVRDFGDETPLAGMYFQRRLEEMAFRTGGAGYKAPAQKVSDFLAHRPSSGWGSVKPSYSCGTAFACLDDCLPDYVCKTLRLALPELDKKLHGFAFPDAVMTGVETRSSSPLRMIRGETGESPLKGLYPCGEGAGYAGGIVSAAADGVKTALQIIKKLESAA